MPAHLAPRAMRDAGSYRRSWHVDPDQGPGDAAGSDEQTQAVLLAGKHVLDPERMAQRFVLALEMCSGHRSTGYAPLVDVALEQPR